MSERARIEDAVCDLLEPLLRRVEVMIDKKFSVYLADRRPPVAASPPPLAETESLLTRIDVAERLRVDRRTVTRWIKEGKLCPLGGRRGKWITQAEFERFVVSRGEGGGDESVEREALRFRLMKK